MPRYLDPLGDDLALGLTESAARAQLVEAPIIPAAGGGVTGTIASTNANDSVSASGTSTTLGTISRTNANDTVTASGTSGTSGTITRTNANDTAAASGTSGTFGTIASTNANDSVSASGDAGQPPQPTGGGAARPRMRYERQPLPTIEDELEEIALALLLLL